MGNRRLLTVRRAGSVAVFAVVTAAAAGQMYFPAVLHPAENLPNDAKRVLGKALFFDEQLSADGSVACATCHVMSRGGTDPRRHRSPGKDGSLGDATDAFGSPGVVAMASNGKYHTQDVFGASRQVTGRSTPSPFTSTYSESVFWDGRAGGQYTDPVTHEVLIAKGGALESQALLPFVNPIEMGHTDRSFAEIVASAQSLEPLALADRLPADLASALADKPGYPELFSRAFGDPQITAPRIAMAIATYERTLLPDGTDYDRFMAGDETALTAVEKDGLTAFHDAGCATCHAPPLFTDNTFRATGVRAPQDDEGRGAITSLTKENGQFKVPSLRNVALKTSFFHDGKRTTLHEAIEFYHRSPLIMTTGNGNTGNPGTFGGTGNPGGSGGTVGYGGGDDPDKVQFLENQDPAMNEIHLSPQRISLIEAFLTGGLVDPRVQDETFPFDRPTLASEHADLQTHLGDAGQTGSHGVPQIIVTTPATEGNSGFRVGLAGVPNGVTAELTMSWDGGAAPVVSETVTTGVASSTSGGATLFVPLPDVEAGTTLHLKWRVHDPKAPGGVSISRTAEVPVFAPRTKALAAPGSRREARDPATVDDRIAHVAMATFRLRPSARASRRKAARDTLYFVGRVNPRGAGTDLSQAKLTVRVGDKSVLERAPLDAGGRLSTRTSGATFDRNSGGILVSLQRLDLRQKLRRELAGRRGTVHVPLTVTIEGLGLAEPTVATEVAFAWRARANGSVSGRFTFGDTGSQPGAFQLPSVSMSSEPGNRVRIGASGVLDLPGDEPFSAPLGLDLRIGTAFHASIATGQLVTSQSNGTISAGGPAALRSLVIDTKLRTIFLEVVLDDPSLAAVPTGSIVPLRFRIEVPRNDGGPALTFETVPDVVAR